MFAPPGGGLNDESRYAEDVVASRLEVGIATSLRSVALEVPSRLLISTDSPLVDEPRCSTSVGASGRVDDEGPADDSPADVGVLEAMAHGRASARVRFGRRDTGCGRGLVLATESWA